jgi:hypothetical protein
MLVKDPNRDRVFAVSLIGPIFLTQDQKVLAALLVAAKDPSSPRALRSMHWD